MRRNSAHSAAPEAPRYLTDVLNADELGLVLYWLPLAHDIAATAQTCCALKAAAKLVVKVRPFSGEVVTLGGDSTHQSAVCRVAAAPNGHVVTGSFSGNVKVWRVGRYRTWDVPRSFFEAHSSAVDAMAVAYSGVEK